MIITKNNFTFSNFLLFRKTILKLKSRRLMRLFKPVVRFQSRLFYKSFHKHSLYSNQFFYKARVSGGKQLFSRKSRFIHHVRFKFPIRFKNNKSRFRSKYRYQNSFRFIPRYKRVYNLLVRQTVNNIFITLLSTKGRTLSTSTLGLAGLRGARKYTPYGAELSGRRMGLRMFRRRMRAVNIILKSYPTSLVSAILKGLFRYRVVIKSIRNEVPLAHNGLRPRKHRRK
jgi:small subunit ribosomal protein S11